MKYGFPAGVNEVGGANKVRLFPNPTTSIIMISEDQMLLDATIKLFDLTGNLILEKEHQSGKTLTLDISSQPDGMYFIEMLQSTDIWTRKIIKE